MASPTLTNEEAAAGMNGDGLGFVLQTTHSIRKDQARALLLPRHAFFKRSR